MIGRFFFAVCLVISVTAYGQVDKVIIKREFNNAPLSEVIQFLEEVSGEKFSYSNSSLPLQEDVTITFDHQSLTQALDKLTEVVPIKYKIINKKVVLMYNTLKQTIRGTIRDESTQSPIIGATVTVLGTEPLLGAASDIEGNFRIEGVSLGRRSLKVSYIGYEEKILPNILIGSGKEAIININLTESITQMDEIVILDKGVASLPVNDMAQVSARSFTVEETKRFPISLGDPLRLASSFAGVVNQDDTNNGIVIRGNTPRGILWKLDGIEIPSPNHFSSEGASSGGISMFSTQVISRSDFFTGAFAPEYGNATAGVFDINLRQGNNQKRENTVQAGLLGLDVSSEGPIMAGKKSSYLFNYRYSTLGILTQLGLDLLDPDEKTAFQDLSFKLNFPTKSLGTFSVFGLGGKSSITNDFFPESGREEYSMGVVGLTNQFNIDKKSFVKMTVAASGTKVIDDFFLKGDEPFSSTKDFRKTFGRAFIQVNRKFSAKNVVEGGFTYSLLNYSFQDREEAPLAPPPYDSFSPFDEKGDTGSKQAYLSWRLRLSDKLSFVNGVHMLHFDLTGESSWEPRSSLRWQVEPDKALSLGFGKHSRIESLEYYFGNFIANNGAILKNNTNLGLTKSNHFVIGYEKAFNDKAYFRTEVYYQHLYNVPVFLDSLRNAFSTLNLTDGYTSEQLINAGTGRNYGVEFTFERTFADSYYYLINLSIYSSKYRARDGAEWDTRFNGNGATNWLFGKEFNVGKNAFNNILGVSMKMTWAGNKRYTPINVNASRQFNQEIRPIGQNYKAKYPDYTRTDLQISFRRNTKKTTSEWRLDVQNLLGKKNVLYDFYSVGGRRVVQEKGVGIIPVLSYRLEF